MSILSTSVSFKQGQVSVTTLSLESGALKVDVRHYDSLFFGSVGVLVHLCKIQYDAFEQAFKAMGLTKWDLDEYKASLVLTGGKNRLAALSEKHGYGWDAAKCAEIHAKKCEIFQEYMRKEGLTVRPGVIELLEQARANGVKTAWVTTTPEGSMRAQLDGMKGLSRNMFDCVISEADQVHYGRGKPTADPYLFVMKNLGVRNPLCFEDSQISMGAPLAANLDCIATPNEWCVGHNFSAAIGRVAEPVDLLKKTGLSDAESKTLASLVEKAQIRC